MQIPSPTFNPPLSETFPDLRVQASAASAAQCRLLSGHHYKLPRVWSDSCGTRLMTNCSTSTTAPVPQWSINARPVDSLSNISPSCSDHDPKFLDKLLYLKPGKHCLVSKILSHPVVNLLMYSLITRKGWTGVTQQALHSYRSNRKWRYNHRGRSTCRPVRQETTLIRCHQGVLKRSPSPLGTLHASHNRPISALINTIR